MLSYGKVLLSPWTWLLIMAVGLFVMGTLWVDRGKTIESLQSDLTQANANLEAERRATAKVLARNRALEKQIKKFKEGRNDPESIEWASVLLPDGERHRMHSLLYPDGPSGVP